VFLGAGFVGLYHEKCVIVISIGFDPVGDMLEALGLVAAYSPFRTCTPSSTMHSPHPISPNWEAHGKRNATLLQSRSKTSFFR
jgi:hypothetical protein